METSFNLPAPPGFRGFDPALPVRIYHRHFPHWRQAGASYFVTFRLADSIPQDQLQALRRWRRIWEQNNPEPRSEGQWEELAREITRRTEVSLDQGYGECVFRDHTLSDELAGSLLHFQNDRWFVPCYAILPNHVHLIAQPLGAHELEDVLESVKRYVSRHVNEYLDRSGTLWGEESYDRIIRDEEHLWQCVQYIGNNPGKAGLPIGDWVRWIHPEWERLGWRFL